MNTQNLKRYIMPLFAFFIMLAGAKAEVETVSNRSWRVDCGMTIWDVQYSKADKYVIAQGGGSFLFLDPKTGKQISSIGTRFIEAKDEGEYYYGTVRFINNDAQFLIESEDRKTIDCYNFEDMKKMYSLEAVGGDIINFDITKDEKKIVARVGNKEMKIWNLETKAIIAQYTLPTNKDEVAGYLRVPRFNPEGNEIIVSTYSKIPDGTGGYPPQPVYKIIQNLVVFNQNLDSIGVRNNLWHSFIWSKSGKYIATLNRNAPFPYYEISILDAKTFSIVNKFLIDGGPIANMFFANDELHFVVSYGVNVDICRVYRMADGKNTINYQTGSADAACLSNSGSEIVFSNGAIVFQYAFSATSSVEKGVFNNGFISFPNPINDKGILKFNQEKPGITKIYLSNEKGSIVKEISNSYFETGLQAVAIDASDLANGVYFITVNNDTQNFTSKIIVQR